MVLPSVLWLRLCCRKDLRLSLTSQRIRNQWWAAQFVWTVVNSLNSIIQTSSEFKQTTAHRQQKKSAVKHHQPHLKRAACLNTLQTCAVGTMVKWQHLIQILRRIPQWYDCIFQLCFVSKAGDGCVGLHRSLRGKQCSVSSDSCFYKRKQAYRVHVRCEQV